MLDVQPQSEAGISDGNETQEGDCGFWIRPPRDWIPVPPPTGLASLTSCVPFSGLSVFVCNKEIIVPPSWGKIK